MTGSMQRAIDETESAVASDGLQRNSRNRATNDLKPINDLAESRQIVVDAENEQLEELVAQASELSDRAELTRLLDETRTEMLGAAERLDFERAAQLRDQLLALEKIQLMTS